MVAEPETAAKALDSLETPNPHFVLEVQMKHCNKPTTRIDQAEIIPFIPQKEKPKSPETWEGKLERALNEVPKIDFDDFCWPVYHSISHLLVTGI